MTNEQIRRLIYAIIRQCDDRNAPMTHRIALIRLQAVNVLEILRQEMDTALTVEREQNREPDGDVIFA